MGMTTALLLALSIARKEWRDRSYRAGTSPNWLKVKNPRHPAMQRVKEAFS
jgi:hypothetical protein